ncbi:transcription antitermination factor NusB [Metamycoplasma gateae]|uniref:Transcription antitermination factor NusB n=1 Tax=Metamycoplasma gateae TaxID=35769 RepID=A0ABZ2AKB8_9BACT|nr:transcription antitermination factor NusB [Metamycoplasma gateae]
MEDINKTNNKDKFLIKKYNFRKNIINYIYQYELFNIQINTSEIVNNELNKISISEISTLEIIQSKYQTLKNIANKFLLETWTWERINPLIRAVLIFGIYELTYNEPRVVINEMVNITKMFVPGDDYKFVNRILDRISKEIINK